MRKRNVLGTWGWGQIAGLGLVVIALALGIALRLRNPSLTRFEVIRHFPAAYAASAVSLGSGMVLLNWRDRQ